MISLRLLMLVLITLGCREWVKGDPQVVPLTASLAALGMSLGFGLLFKVSALRLLTVNSIARDRLDGSHTAQHCSRIRQRIEGAWLLCLPLALLATGWGAALNNMQELGLPQAVALVGWFLPSLFLLMLLELTAAQFDELCQGSERAVASTSVTWPSEWLLRMRLGEMAGLITCTVPVLLIAAATDVVRLFADDLLLSRLLLVATLFALGCVVLFLPVWLGKWMGVSDFPTGQLRQRIETQLSILELRGIRPRLLCSRGRWPGAAIVGWFPRFRQLWLGDALIERLTPEQLDMVVMHELAHVTGKHFLWRVFPMLWAGGVVAMFSIFWPTTAGLELVGTLLSSTVACVVMLIGMSAMAHECELEADRTACALAERACNWAQAQPGQAAKEMSGALVRLLCDSPQAAESSWLHPSLRRRLSNLRR